MLNLWTFFLWGSARRTGIAENVRFWKILYLFLGVPWLCRIQESVGTPVTVALEPTRPPEPAMLQGTGYTEMWHDAESS